MIYGKGSHGYRLARQSVFGFRGSRELGSMIEKEHEALLSRFILLEVSLMDEVHVCRDPKYHNIVGQVLQFRGSSEISRETL